MKDNKDLFFVMVVITILVLTIFWQFGNIRGYIVNEGLLHKSLIESSSGTSLMPGQDDQNEQRAGGGGRGSETDTIGSYPPLMGFPTGNTCDSGTYQGSCNGGFAMRCISGNEWGEECGGECFTYTDSNGNTQARCTGNCYTDCQDVCIDIKKYANCEWCRPKPENEEPKKKYKTGNCPPDTSCQGGKCVGDMELPPL